jgi:hypothetical protein
MSLLQKAFDTLAKVKTDIQSELKGHETALTQLRKEREVTERLPVPKAEFLSRLDSAIDAQREEYERVLFGLLQPLTQPGRVSAIINPLGLEAGTQLVNGQVPSFNLPERGTVTGFALQGLLGDTIKDALHQAAERMAYPTETGLPAAERQKRLSELDKEIAALEAKASDLREQLNQAGLRV